MGYDSKIGWTDHTFNPWIGCAHVSPGCANCYAEAMANHYRWAKWGKGSSSTRRITADSTWKQPRTWNRQAKRDGVVRRVFCASLADVFEDRPELVEPRARLFDLIHETPCLHWLILTKRMYYVADLLSRVRSPENPPNNVSLGVSAEDQTRWNARVCDLVAGGSVPNRWGRFVSAEPLLGSVGGVPPGLDVVICGGESGPNARPMLIDWAAELRDGCKRSDVPFFFKQTGEKLARRLKLRDKAGADPSEWPTEFRDVFVRELPERWTSKV